MKNILKKIGLIAIIVGVLSPFITLPSVNAATEECKYYLNQYLFLDTFVGSEIEVYELGGKKEIGKRNFTNFMYIFEPPVANERIEIVNSGNVDLSRGSGLEEYYNAYSLIYGDEKKIDHTQFRKIPQFGAWVKTEDYENVTTIVHGKWANDNTDSQDYRIAQTSSWPDFDDFEDFEDETIQYYIGDDVKLFTRLGGATLEPDGNKEKFGLPRGTYSYNFETYLDKIISDYNSGNKDSYGDNYLIKDNNETYFNINILREIEITDLEDLTYGYEGKVLSTTNTENQVTKSYEALVNYNKNGGNCPDTAPCYLVNSSDDIDIDIKKSYYWPALYNVEYKICKPVSTSSWTLTYDRGVSAEEVVNVTNMPDKQPNITTTSVPLSDKKPERKNYVFKSWCTDKEGKGTCVESGKQFENKEMTDKTVYAYWVKPGAADSEKTGVISYVLGFIGVGVIAYGLYYVINKKNLFKQI